MIEIEAKKVIDDYFKADLRELKLESFKALMAIIKGDVTNGIVNSIYVALNAKGIISNKIFADKLISFLYGMAEVPLSEKTTFVSKYINGNENEFYSKLCLLIDGVSSLECGVITGGLMRAFMYQKLTKGEFMMAVNAVRNSIIESLEVLKKMESGKGYSFSDEVLLLVASGLMYDNSGFWAKGIQDEKFQLTNIGEIVKKFGFEDSW